jgi:hypothetical protein
MPPSPFNLTSSASVFDEQESHRALESDNLEGTSENLLHKSVDPSLSRESYSTEGDVPALSPVAGLRSVKPDRGVQEHGRLDPHLQRPDLSFMEVRESRCMGMGHKAYSDTQVDCTLISVLSQQMHAVLFMKLNIWIVTPSWSSWPSHTCIMPCFLNGLSGHLPHVSC